MTINERFKEIRLKLGKTQAEFGEQCGLGRPVIANIENNRSPVTPLYIKVVVDNFGVNEDWLINGIGEMFLETKEQFIDKIADQYGLDDFMKKVITAYSELSDSEKDAVKSFIAKFTPPSNPEQSEWLNKKSSTTAPTAKLTPLKPEEPTESVLKLARSSDDQGAETARISKSEISAALADREKDDSTLK